MSIKKIFPVILMLAALNGYSQSVGVNTDGSIADVSSLLDVKSTTKGVLVPRMTLAQRNAIATPATGLLIYQTDGTDGFYVNKGTTLSPNWQAVSGAGVTGAVSVLNGVSQGTLTTTISDINVRSIIVQYGGLTGALSTINLTIPSASSYPSGTVLSFSLSAYITANPSWILTSASSTYHSLNFNGVSMASGVGIGATNGFRIVAVGSNWYRLLP